MSPILTTYDTEGHKNELELLIYKFWMQFGVEKQYH